MIEFHFNEVDFDLESEKVSSWIGSLVDSYENEIDELNIIFCTDEYLFEMNKKHLQHDYYTDIITFPYQDDPISADIFISYDRVQENAITYKVNTEHELLRVIIHGVLHLLGFGDKTQEEQSKMRELEENAILKFYNNEQ